MEVCSSTEMGAPGASHLGTGDHGPKTDRSRPRSVPVNALAVTNQLLEGSRRRVENRAKSEIAIMARGVIEKGSVRFGNQACGVLGSFFGCAFAWTLS